MVGSAAARGGTSLEGLRELRACGPASHVHQSRRLRGRGERLAPADGSPATASRRSSDLVAELIAATELVPRDRLAAARGRAGIGGLAQALQDEGYAHPDGVARSLARRYGFPFIDLSEERASPSASELIPLKTLQRVVAVPMSRTDDRLRVAVADPANIHGIDELRLATRYTVDIGVANREEILAELERLARQSEAMERSRRSTTSRWSRTRTTSRSTTASRTRRSCGSSTRS